MCLFYLDIVKVLVGGFILILAYFFMRSRFFMLRVYFISWFRFMLFFFGMCKLFFIVLFDIEEVEEVGRFFRGASIEFILILFLLFVFCVVFFIEFLLFIEFIFRFEGIKFKESFFLIIIFFLLLEFFFFRFLLFCFLLIVFLDFLELMLLCSMFFDRLFDMLRYEDFCLFFVLGRL